MIDVQLLGDIANAAAVVILACFVEDD